MSTLLQDGVTARAQTRPEAVALSFRDSRMSYGELEAASNRLAHLLLEAGCRRGDRIALLMPKMPTAIVALLGALKAGAIYVPLDPSGPAARLAKMLETSECRFLLAAGSVTGLLRDTLAAAHLQRHPDIGWLGGDSPSIDVLPAFTSADVASHSSTVPAVDAADSDVAHLLFTSGSTGSPKGVMVTHRSVAHFLGWAGAHFGIDSSDRASQHPPLHFDLSTFDIFGTLWAGAELCLVPPELNVLPHTLANFMRDTKLTQWFSVPSVLSLMAKFDVVAYGDLPSLRRVMWCGEAIPTPTLIYWMQRLPHASFTNLYGPTEATIASSYYTVPACPSDERAPIPIGTACAGEELMILDERMRPVPPGETGELYIRGVGLSPGYWRDLEKTRCAFLPCPGERPEERIYRTGDLARRAADGIHYFVGRADTQIKSRGYRIELGEIEAALSAIPSLQENAVVAIESDGFEGWTICCAYVPAPGARIAPTGLREHLTTVVPGYMVPARWMHYDSLPKNGNGKIDRPRLRSAFLAAERRPSERQPQAPRSSTANAAGLAAAAARGRS